MLTIAFSSHHAETLPFARREMERHGLIVLEEPPSPKFSSMLEGRVSIDEYMLESESAFPEFERRMSALLQRLHRKGRKIVQVEPYLERLMEIHEHFAEGIEPEEVMKMPGLSEVYKAERAATGALILSEGILFLPVVVARRAKNCYPPSSPRLVYCSQVFFVN